MTKAQFFDLMAPLAHKARERFGVPARLTLAQAAIESQWGRRPIGNNYFGIKQAARHKQHQTVMTTEQKPTGETWRARLAFADYPTVEDGVMDYAWLISQGRPYRQAWQAYQTHRNIEQLGTEIARVYATGLQYGTLLRTLVRQRDIVEAANDPG